MKEVEHQYTKVLGQQINFLESGEGERVLLFHASGNQAIQWSHFMATQSNYHCIAPDFSWYGENDLAPAAKLAPLLDQQIVEAFLIRYSPCHVIGHSYGGALLLEALQKTEHKILSATLIEPESFQLLRDRDAAFHEIDELVQTLMHFMDDNQRISAAKKFINYWSYLYAWEFMDHRVREYTIERIEKIIFEFLPMYTKDNMLKFKQRVDYPVFLMRGQWTKKPSLRIMHLLEEFFEVESLIIPMGGHLSPITKSHAVSRELIKNLGNIQISESFSDKDQLNL